MPIVSVKMKYNPVSPGSDFRFGIAKAFGKSKNILSSCVSLLAVIASLLGVMHETAYELTHGLPDYSMRHKGCAGSYGVGNKGRDYTVLKDSESFR